jgi:hypothetical protein
MRKSSTPKAAVKKRRATRRKTTSKVVAKQARDEHQPTNPKVVADLRRQSVTKFDSREVADTRRMVAAQFEKFRDTQVPETMRALAERSVVQTREAYEHSKIALQSVLESWNKSFGAAGKGTMALNSKIIDIAERNIDNNFDFAMSLCRAKNLAEVMELQAAYLRKQFGQLRSQAEEVRLLSTKAYVGAGALKRNQ